MKFIAFALFISPIFSLNALAQAEKSIEKRLLEQIQKAEITIEDLRKSANLIDDNHHIGTAHNEIDGREHSCYALGMLLGQEKNVLHLNINKNPIIRASDSDEAHALRVIAQSLENFIQATKYAINLSKDERIIEWNLDCTGHHKIPKNPIPQSKNTFYQVKHDGKMLQILGNIEPGFSTKLQQAIEANPNIKVVALGSGGGLVKEALIAGQYIRSKNLETTLWNNCHSACPLVFLGGKARTIMSPYPYLGFHKIYTKQGAIPNSDPIYREVANYTNSMGASSNYILKQMLSAEPSQMRIIKESDDLCKFGVATWIQRVC
jgi:hypothetical protein